MGFRWYWTIYFSIPLRGRTVADAHAIGTDAISLLETHDQGAATIESLTALLRSGHAGALVGMPEGQLLEAKRHIHLEDERAGWSSARTSPPSPTPRGRPHRGGARHEAEGPARRSGRCASLPQHGPGPPSALTPRPDRVSAYPGPGRLAGLRWLVPPGR